MKIKKFAGIIENLILLTPLLIPSYLLRFNLIGIPTNFFELWIVSLSIAFFFASFNKIKEIGIIKKFKLEILFFIAILFYGLISIKLPSIELLNDGTTEFTSRTTALGILKGWIFIPYLYWINLKLLFLTAEPHKISNLNPQNHQTKLLLNLILSALGYASIAIYQILTNDFLTPDNRVSGPFNNANYLALYLGPIVSIGISLLIKSQLKNKEKYILGGFTTLLSIILIYSQSYAGILAVAISSLISLIVYKRNRAESIQKIFISQKTKIFIGLLIGILTLIGGIIFSGTEKAQRFFDTQNRGSTSVRIELYQVAIGLIQRNPILGIGIGQFQKEYNLYSYDILQRIPHEWVMIHPHNIFLSTWLYFGIPGVFILLFVLTPYWQSFINKFPFNSIKIAAFGGLSTILIHGQFDTAIYKNDLAILFVICLFLLKFPVRDQIKATVQNGLQIGRTIGFPTLNLKQPKSTENLAHGIYSCFVKIDNKWYNGAAHHGPRPAINRPEPVLEIHVMDNFTQEIYGKTVDAEIGGFVRGVMNFKSLEDLKQQIKRDTEFCLRGNV